jgi:hypothetical protein
MISLTQRCKYRGQGPHIIVIEVTPKPHNSVLNTELCERNGIKFETIHTKIFVFCMFWGCLDPWSPPHCRDLIYATALSPSKGLLYLLQLFGMIYTDNI